MTPNKLSADNMLDLMGLAGKEVHVERSKSITVNIFLPEARWAAFWEQRIFEGWTRRQVVRKAFEATMIVKDEN